MNQSRLRNTRLVSVIIFMSSVVVSALTVQILGKQGLLPYIVFGSPGLQGILNARSTLKYHRQTQSSKVVLIVELICAGLLILTVAAAFMSKSLIAVYCSWIFAAIATFPLTITSAIEVIQALRQKHHRRRNITKFLLNCLALLIYVILLISFFFLLIVAVSGESYMGN